MSVEGRGKLCIRSRCMKTLRQEDGWCAQETVKRASWRKSLEGPREGGPVTKEKSSH